MLTAEEQRLKQLKRRRIFIVAVALVVVLVVGFFTTRPALNAVKAWQARRHANNAFAYIDKANWMEARKEATAAYQLRPTEPQSVRAVARFLSRTRQPDALEFWQQLEKLTPLTREDRQDEAAIAIVSGETARAEIAVQALLESKGADPIGWLLAAQLAIQKGAADDAMSALGKVFNDAKSTEQQQLQAALLELALTSDRRLVADRKNFAGKKRDRARCARLIGKTSASTEQRARSGEQRTTRKRGTPTSELPAPGSKLGARAKVARSSAREGASEITRAGLAGAH